MVPVVPASLAFPDPRPYAAQIRAAQLDIVYRRLPMLLSIDAAFSTAAMLYCLWYWVPKHELALWLSAVIAIVIPRVAAYIAYRDRKWNRDPKIYGAIITAIVGLSGILWGAFCGFLFQSTPLIDDHLYLFFLAGGIGFIAASALNPHPPAFYAFFLPPILILSGMSLHASMVGYKLIAIVGVAFAISLVFFVRNKYMTSVQSLALQFQLLNMARELGEQRDAAERANVGKSKFLAAASHDLRQPLHALTLLTSALDESTQSATTGGIVKDIKSAVGSLEKLFDALLDISRLDAGVLQPKLRHFNLAALIKNLSSEYAPSARAKNLELVAVPCDSVVRSDPTLLERLLRNYLSNAIRYTETGQVKISCTRSPQGISIEVADSGVGIPTEHQSEIFSEFFQLANPERDRAKGLGLGLAIVRRIAELLEHPIGVESLVGRGSRFTVLVPEGDASLVETEAAKFESRVDLTGLRVVVIDDSIEARDGARTLLSLWGCEVVAGESDDEVVKILRDRGSVPEALLVDYRLRDHRTGLQAVERIRNEFGRAIPAMIVSGDTDPERLREVASRGHTLVHKPMQPAVLRAFLHNVHLERAT